MAKTPSHHSLARPGIRSSSSWRMASGAPGNPNSKEKKPSAWCQSGSSSKPASQRRKRHCASIILVLGDCRSASGHSSPPEHWVLFGRSLSPRSYPLSMEACDYNHDVFRSFKCRLPQSRLLAQQISNAVQADQQLLSSAVSKSAIAVVISWASQPCRNGGAGWILSSSSRQVLQASHRLAHPSHTWVCHHSSRRSPAARAILPPANL